MSERNKEPVRLVAIGRVRRAVGLDGKVEVELYSGDNSRLTRGLSLTAGDRQIVVARAAPGRKGLLSVYFEGVTDRDASDLLRGLELEMPESALPKPPDGVFYHYQLIGADVKDLAGRHIGTVSGIIETGSNDVYVVASERGNEILIPATRDAVKEVDTVNGVIVADLPGETTDPTEDRQ